MVLVLGVVLGVLITPRMGILGVIITPTPLLVLVELSLLLVLLLMFPVTIVPIAGV
jgi:hypothetical protein